MNIVLKLVVLCCVLFIGCSDFESTPDLSAAFGDSETPVFQIEGMLDNEQIFIEAGRENYYMFTSYGLDSNSVLSFHGLLKDVGCNSQLNCDQLITEFIIYDNKVYDPNKGEPVELNTTQNIEFVDLTGDGGNALLPMQNIGIVLNVYLNGLMYSTGFALQNESSFFEITEVESYKANEVGNETRKIGIRFECTLKNNLNQSIGFTEGGGIIGVALPSN